MMSARDIASIISRIRKAEKEMTDPDPDVMTRAMNRYDKAMQDFEKAGGYAAQSEATAMAASLGLPQEVMGQQLGSFRRPASSYRIGPHPVSPTRTR